MMENHANDILQSRKAAAIPTTKRKLTIRFGLIVLAVALLLGGGGYWYGTTTPYYSIQNLGRAVAAHDMAAFEKYVDINAVSAGAFDQITSIALEDPDEVRTNLTEMAKGVLDALKPPIVEQIGQQIRCYVQDGNFDAIGSQIEQNPVNLKALCKLTNIESGKVKGVKYLRKDQDGLTVVGVETILPEYEAPVIFDFKMRDCGSYWQLVDISNLGDAIRGINQARKAAIEVANQPVVDAMNKTLTFDRITPVYFAATNQQNAAIQYLISTDNKGQRTIQTIEIEFRISDEEGQLLVKERLTVNGNWATGAQADIVWTKVINPLVNADKILYNTPTDQLSFKIKPLRIRFTDNTEFKIQEQSS